MNKIVCIIKDANGDILGTWVGELPSFQLAEFRSRVARTGCYLEVRTAEPIVTSMGNGLLEYIEKLEDES